MRRSGSIQEGYIRVRQDGHEFNETGKSTVKRSTLRFILETRVKVMLFLKISSAFKSKDSLEGFIPIFHQNECLLQNMIVDS